MIKITLMLIFISGCCAIYLTQKHQNWLKKGLPKRPWRYIGYLALLTSFIGCLYFYSASAAIFVWIALLMLIFGIIPFLSLTIGKVNQK